MFKIEALSNFAAQMAHSFPFATAQSQPKSLELERSTFRSLDTRTAESCKFSSCRAV